MYTSKFLRKIFTTFILGSFFIISCTTEDILPAVELSVDNVSFGEDLQSVVLTATLNSNAIENVTIPISFSGSASSSDYTSSAASISIATGSKSGAITITSTQDQDIEGTETVIASVGNASGFLLVSMNEVTISLLDDDIDSDNDGVTDNNDNCPNTPGSLINNGCPFSLVINEVNFDPASGSSGDANGDGTRSSSEDEFVEIFNSGPQIDLSGYTVSDASQVRHTFAAGTILPENGVLVLFGGGTPTGDFGGAIAIASTSGNLNLTNGGDSVIIRDASGVVILEYISSSNNIDHGTNQSVSRNPDLTGEFVEHSTITEANGALFSPGTKLDGSSF